MNKILSALLLTCCFYCSGYSQQVSYTIEASEEMNLPLLHKTLESSNMDPYRMEDKRVLLHFKDGSMIELFSANEMIEKGIPINLKVINRSGMPNMSQWMLHESGTLIEEPPVLNVEEQKKRDAGY